VTSYWRRAAASVALLVGGAALGRLTAPHAVAAAAGTDAQVASANAVPGNPAAPTRADSTARPARGLSDTLPVHGEPTARLASRQESDVATIADANDAMRLLTRAQRDYQRAAAWLSEHDSTATTGTPQTLRARLAALDEVLPKLGEALHEAPQDPVINQYYLTASDVRESTLRQLGRALPVGVRLNGY
jgi:hypothetical protein